MELMPAVVCLAKHYGVRGVLIYIRLKLGFTNRIHVPRLPHPISLRKGTSDISTFQEIFTYDEYEVNLNFSPATIIDAGANVGLASVFFANKYPKATVICVEPEKSNFDLLKQNVGNYKNILPLKNAISNISGEVINVVDTGDGNWAFRTESVESSRNKKVSDSAKTITITDIIKQNGIDTIDILKVDIEGAEGQLFESGYNEWLPRTRCLIIELHDRYIPGSSRKVFKAISEYNFSYSQNGENLIFINEDVQINETQLVSQLQKKDSDKGQLQSPEILSSPRE